MIKYTKGEKIGGCIYIHDIDPYEYPNSKKRHRKALFECKCGNKFEALITNIKHGDTKSCGCQNRENIKKKTEKRVYNHLLYGIWQNMKNRCKNSKTSSYKFYGGKGIKVCEDWVMPFSNFYNWSKENGWEPGLTIDRIDSSGDYEPSNCRWVTPMTQARNRSSNINVEHNGVLLCLKDYCEVNNLNYGRVRGRINRYKWSIERAITEPSMREMALKSAYENPSRSA